MSILRRLGRRSDVWIALGILSLTLLSRVPFRSRVLHHWDSVNFALAIEHFDVRLHQPHPPGTFVIYIMLGRLLNLLLHDPNASLVWVSVVMGGLGSAALYLLTAEWFGRHVGLTAALLSIVSPLVWFHSEVALSYTLELFWVTLIVYSCYAMRTRRWWPLLVSALLMGLAGGVRPNTPVFLFPLWVGGIIVHKYPWHRILVALLVLGLGVLVWAVPMLIMSGGLLEYIDIMRWWQDQHVAQTSGLRGVVENVTRFGMYAAYSLGLGLIPMAVAAVRELPTVARSLRRDWRAQVLGGWTVPAAAYLTFVHLKQPGHTFTIQPAFFVLAGLAIVALARRHGAFRRSVWVGALCVVLLASGAFFLAGPVYLFGDTRMLFTTPTWSTIREYDTYVTQRLDAIRGAFLAEETVVLADSRNYRLLDFYLPDFQLTSLSHELGDDVDSVVLPQHVRVLVLFDDSVLPDLLPSPYLHLLPIPEGGNLRYVEWDTGRQVALSPTGILVSPR